MHQFLTFNILHFLHKKDIQILASVYILKQTIIKWNNFDPLCEVPNLVTIKKITNGTAGKLRIKLAQWGERLSNVQRRLNNVSTLQFVTRLYQATMNTKKLTSLDWLWCQRHLLYISRTIYVLLTVGAKLSSVAEGLL